MDSNFCNIAKKHMNDEQVNRLYSFVKEIIEHDEYQKRKKYLHHDDSVFDHCLYVCILSLKIAYILPFKFDYKAIAVGSLLHDFYHKPWQLKTKKKKFFKQHGFSHSLEALDNATIHFNHMTTVVSKDAIKNHMWPLTIRHIPTYRESWVVSIADKLESLKVLRNIKKIPFYLGVK